uniref:Serine peptidase inhibitor Kazal type 14 (putative) n=1 Tax=Callithrix jacchus TaxID=9483 RepID=A0A8I3WC82_CALJA
IFSTQFQVECPYEKVNSSWFNRTINPCPGLYQPICGTNFITYDNPCILCVESLKSHGRIGFYQVGKCWLNELEWRRSLFFFPPCLQSSSFTFYIYLHLFLMTKSYHY